MKIIEVCESSYMPILNRLYKRNEYLININSLFKERIVMISGENPQQRASFLNTIYAFTQSVSRAKWQPKLEYDVGF